MRQHPSVRRWVAALLAATVATAAVSLSAGSVLAGTAKVTVCHRDGTLGTYSPIAVSANSHPAKSDYLADLSLTGLTTYALAYTNIDGIAGYSVCDVMIAAFVETSGNADFGMGDTARYGRYPTALSAPYGFAAFPWTSKTVVGTVCSASTLHAFFSADPFAEDTVWEKTTNGSRTLLDVFNMTPLFDVTLVDGTTPSFSDRIFSYSPSISLSAQRPTDDPFIDEQMNFVCPN